MPKNEARSSRNTRRSLSFHSSLERRVACHARPRCATRMPVSSTMHIGLRFSASTKHPQSFPRRLCCRGDHHHYHSRPVLVQRGARLPVGNAEGRHVGRCWGSHAPCRQCERWELRNVGVGERWGVNERGPGRNEEREKQESAARCGRLRLRPRSRTGLLILRNLAGVLECRSKSDGPVKKRSMYFRPFDC